MRVRVISTFRDTLWGGVGGARGARVRVGAAGAGPRGPRFGQDTPQILRGRGASANLQSAQPRWLWGAGPRLSGLPGLR